MIYMQEMTVQIQRLFETENKSFLQDYCTGRGRQYIIYPYFQHGDLNDVWDTYITRDLSGAIVSGFFVWNAYFTEWKLIIL